MMRKTAIAAGAMLFASSAAIADFTGFGYELSTVENSLGSWCVLDLYAEFDDVTDNMLSCLNMDIQLNGGACFYNAGAPPFVPQSLIPLTNVPSADEAFAADSYITIGNTQQAASNGTNADPNFADNCDNVGVNGGWFNLPPDNGQGAAATGRVFMGRFSVTTEEALAGASLSVSGQVAFNSGQNIFDDMGTVFWILAPGAIAMLGVAGLVGSRRRRG